MVNACLVGWASWGLSFEEVSSSCVFVILSSVHEARRCCGGFGVVGDRGVAVRSGVQDADKVSTIRYSPSLLGKRMLVEYDSYM